MTFLALPAWEPDRPWFYHGAPVLKSMWNMTRINGAWCASRAFIPADANGISLPAGQRALFVGSLVGTSQTAISVVITNERVYRIGRTALSDEGAHGLTNPKGFQVAVYGNKAYFADVGGAGMFILGASDGALTAWPTGSDVPVGASVGIIGNRLAVANIANEPNVVRLSSLHDQTDFTDATSDTITFATGGRVLAVVGGDSGAVFCEDSIYRITPLVSTAQHSSQVISNNLGLYGSTSFFALAGRIYFLSESGFKVLNQHTSTEIADIGANIVDKFVLSQISADRRDEIVVYHDENDHQIVWAYPALEGSDTHLSNSLSFNYLEGTWGNSGYYEEGSQSALTIESVGSIRGAPRYSDLPPEEQSDTGAVANIESDDAVFGSGNRRIVAFDGSGRLREFGTQSVADFGAETTLSNVGLIVQESNPRREQIKSGDAVFINEIELIGDVDIGEGNVEVWIRSGRFIGSSPPGRETARPDYLTGVAAFHITTNNAGIGFRAYNQNSSCTIAGWNFEAQGGGHGIASGS